MTLDEELKYARAELLKNVNAILTLQEVFRPELKDIKLFEAWEILANAMREYLQAEELNASENNQRIACLNELANPDAYLR